MCEFCHQHGEGKTWYLLAQNYAEDLLSDLRRREMISEFFTDTVSAVGGLEQLDRLESAPSFVQRAIKGRITARMKRRHFGQVVPIEDVEQILGFVNSVIRLPCVCRHATAGASDARYCYGISMGPNGGKMGEIIRGLDDSFLTGPDTAGVEALKASAALEAIREHEKEGLCHTVWTFMTPFIGGVCNCDRADCMAMQATVVRNVPVMFRAEYVAEVDLDACTGCRSCMRVCQFGAIGYSALNQKALLDQRACYGCGVCRAACPKSAISLRSRQEVPVAAERW